MIKFIKSLQENNAPRSRVWLVEKDGRLWVHKHQPKHLCNNEAWVLETLQKTGYVPAEFERLDQETLLILYYEPQLITNKVAFRAHCTLALRDFEAAGIRHGDLTKYAVIPHENQPIIIDWAESRLACDPRPDKRPEGDAYWLERTCNELCGK